MSPLSVIHFGQCLLQQQTALSTRVPYDNLPFDHPPWCDLSNTDYIDSSRHVSFASVGVISDINTNLLITRRHKDLSSFPSSWVFPGGKLEETEEFEEALIREVKEETGIHINHNKINKEYRYNNKQVKIDPVLKYESLYPDSAVCPLKQVMVLYFLITLPVEFKDIFLNFQLGEIDAYAWINMDEIYSIVHKGKKTHVEAYEYNSNMNQFDKHLLKEDHFTFEPEKKDKIEYIPHGHRRVIEIIHELKTNDSKPKGYLK